MRVSDFFGCDRTGNELKEFGDYIATTETEAKATEPFGIRLGGGNRCRSVGCMEKGKKCLAVRNRCPYGKSLLVLYFAECDLFSLPTEFSE